MSLTLMNSPPPPTQAEQVASAVMASLVDGDVDLLGAMRLILAVVLGKSSGFLANAPIYRDVADTKNRVTAITTADGRVAVEVDPT